MARPLRRRSDSLTRDSSLSTVDSKSTTGVGQALLRRVERLIGAVSAADPAARSALAGFELRDDAGEMLLAGLFLFDEFDPADPLVASERCQAFPLGQCRVVGGEDFFEIDRKSMGGPAGDRLSDHLRLF